MDEVWRIGTGVVIVSIGFWRSSYEPVTKNNARALTVTSAVQEPRQTQPSCWPLRIVRMAILVAEVTRATNAAQKVRTANRRRGTESFWEGRRGYKKRLAMGGERGNFDKIEPHAVKRTLRKRS